MAATASAFRPARKFSFSAATASYDPSGSTSSSSSSANPPQFTSPPPLPTMSPPSTTSAASRQGSSADGGIGASLISPASASGPGGAAVQSGAPMAANTIANKPAVAGSGLYGSCVVLRDRLWCVPGFGDKYLSEATSTSAAGSSSSAAIFHDPVSQLLEVFRLGTPLCELYNLLSPAKPLPTDLGETGSSANTCKKFVAKFIMALQHELRLDPDEIFTVMQVYRENTNDWVQVVRVVSRIVDMLEERGILVESERPSQVEDVAKPSDDRTFIVRELLESERKYVQDLEVLQSCARALQQHGILSADRSHDLFSNLNNLVDFQRRCLINLEDNARRAPDEQRFGRAFQMLERNFDVYWPFCSNYAQALEIVNEEAANIQRLQGLPGAEGCYLDPAYELPAFLIKPVQRICKYPLLLEQLLKKSDPHGPYYDELKEGLAIVQRGAAEVNEVRRQQENLQLVRDLHDRVEDWKGHYVELFGRLLLCDTFMVAKGDTEREYIVYLFDKILLCCKEMTPAPTKKSSKGNSLLKQKTTSISGKKPKTSLQLKGRIFINNVNAAMAEFIPGPMGGTYSLTVQWLGDIEDESFSLRCKNEEQLKQWQGVISKCIEDVRLRKLQSGSASASGTSSPVNMAGAGANGRRHTGSLASAFPQTPLNEYPHVNPFTRANSQMSQHRGHDEDSESTLDAASTMHSASGRGTPMGVSRFSQPAEQRERQMSLQTDPRPRARTEDQDSSVMSQWRSHSPAMPPLPRQASASSASSNGDHTLRKASSSRQLRQGSATHISGGYPRPPRAGAEGSETDLPAAMERQLGRQRGESAAVPPHMLRTYSESSGHQAVRSRSASTSQVAQPAHLHQHAPPLPRSQPGSGLGADQLRVNTSYLSRQGPSSNLSNSSGFDKRNSGSSNATSDSAQSGTSRPGSTATSSPLTMSGSSVGGSLPKSVPGIPQRSGSQGAVQGRDSSPSVNANVVKVQVHYREDKYMLICLANITFAALLEKVVTKIRFCTGHNLDESSRLRYLDEDGDRINLTNDDDVQMAIEQSKSYGQDVELFVVA
ncbi:unnamed protein product [Sympodiomycopsis kandeliae]